MLSFWTEGRGCDLVCRFAGTRADPAVADPEQAETYCRELVEFLKNKQESGIPTILIDASNGSYGTMFHEMLTKEVQLGWLVSYAGFLDMAIVTGTALSHGVARYAFLRSGEADRGHGAGLPADGGGQHSQGLLLQAYRS